MTWPRPSFLELIQQFPEPLFIRVLEVGCDGGRCDARLDRDQVRSMPTSETRADASMTMPLSRTRSSTSISDARKMPRVFRHLVRNNYKRVDRNMWLRICRNYARGAHCQHYNQLVRAPKARLRQQAPAGMTRSEPKCESQGAPPVGRSVRQSSGHRSGELQRPREPVLRSHAELERIRLPRRDGGRTVEEREQGQRSDRVRRTDAPTEGVAEVCARRVADERI